ncbi:DNA repair protein RadA [Leclercia adecarboxylata]|uniref:DNA repair protein RadA n=1 Tax=Leclercia adecarboxylata TaxID=83655 RepID=A0A4U9HIY1_9ENTR|nr:DNA repair protein RadA [Leclercia adecarboxylata]
MGVKVTETSADLALLLAMVSSLRDRPLPQDLVVFGEVGLAGGDPSRCRAARSVSPRRQNTASRRAIVPAANVPQKITGRDAGLRVKKLADALNVFDDL